MGAHNTGMSCGRKHHCLKPTNPTRRNTLAIDPPLKSVCSIPCYTLQPIIVPRRAVSTEQAHPVSEKRHSKGPHTRNEETCPQYGYC